MSEAVRRLTAAGCVAPAEEAEELAVAARGDGDTLAALVGRRSTGEPLAWITGRAAFCGRSVLLAAGVYVPRWQSGPLAERAAALLPPAGRAIDLGTGSGAIACLLLDRRPGASVIGTELDPVAARCARQNGVTVAEGDLFEGVPASWEGTVDVVITVTLERSVRRLDDVRLSWGHEHVLEVVNETVGSAKQRLRIMVAP